VLKIVENLWAVDAPPRTLLGGHSTPQSPSWWGGVAAPPQEPYPPLWAFRSTKNPGHAPAKCLKIFRSTDKNYGLCDATRYPSRSICGFGLTGGFSVGKGMRLRADIGGISITLS